MCGWIEGPTGGKIERLTGRRWLEFVVSVLDQEMQPQEQEIQQADGWLAGWMNGCLDGWMDG